MVSEKKRILFFIGRLSAGGKERRMIELLTYLKEQNKFELMVVVTKDQVHYTYFHGLSIPYYVIKKRWAKSDFTVFYKFYQICKQFRPHIIHSWGRMQSLYTLPAVISQKIPLVNGQITSAPPRINKWSVFHWIDKLNFQYSKVVLANSNAGLDVFNPPSAKRRLIYNGVNMNRFGHLPDVSLIKTKYAIATPYAVIMAASFSKYKDYDLFYRVAKITTDMRNDITFIGAGSYDQDNAEYMRLVNLALNNPRILFPGRTNEVEALINACTIGVLFSNKFLGEGVSNSIIEYMSLCKPVIATDVGGTKEVVRHNINGYLVTGQTDREIAGLIINLVDDKERCKLFGQASRSIVEQFFSLEQMGKGFEQVYQEVLSN